MLKVRIPVKAGMHTIAATFEKDTVMPEGILFRQRGDAIQSYFEGVGNISVAGPYDVQGPGDTASREKIFICHPAAPAEESLARKRSSHNLAHRAYRRPIAADDLPPLIALYKQGAEAGGFEPGIRLALQKILVSPEFLFRVELDPTDARPGAFARSATSSLHRGCPSSCGAAFPTTSCSRSPSAGARAIRRSWRVRSGACWPIRARSPWCRTSPASGCSCAISRQYSPIRQPSRTSMRICARR